MDLRVDITLHLLALVFAGKHQYSQFLGLKIVIHDAVGSN